MEPSYKSSNTSNIHSELYREAIVEQFFLKASNQSSKGPNIEIEMRKPIKKSYSANRRGQLPKLYNNELYHRYSNKLHEIKDKYSRLHEQLQLSASAPQEKPIRELIKDTSDVFSHTYSVKYFGVNMDQIGVLSHRVPLQPPIKNPERHSHLHSQHGLSDRENNSVRPRPKSALIAAKDTLESNEDENFKTEHSHNRISKTKDISTQAMGEISTQTDPQNDVALTKEDGHNAQPNERVIKSAEFTPQMSTTQFQPHPEDYDVYVVNKYVMPKQLPVYHPKKKKEVDDIEKFEAYLDLELRPTPQRIPKQSKLLANYDRAVKGLEKVKRTMLRAPITEQKEEYEPDIETMMEADKFKTYEAKQMLANKVSLSYSKLLSSLENPAVVEQMNNKRLLTTMKSQEEKKKIKGPKISMNPDANIFSSSKDFNARNVAVKIKVERENPLYQNYAKIVRNY